MLFTDDTKQDDHAVACAKAEIYRNHLPEHITKVIFRADGAGCFKSAYHRAINKNWKAWVGIEEYVYRITPAGDGKSALDGMFGIMNVILSSAVDAGMSYQDSDSALEAVGSSSGGHSATKFLTFLPNRHNRLYASYSKDTISWGNVLRSKLDPHTRQLTAFDHSGYGKGVVVNASQAHFSTKVKPTAQMIQKKSENILVNLMLDHRAIRKMFEKTLRSLGERTSEDFNHKIDIVCGEYEAAVDDLVMPSLAHLAPEILQVVVGSKRKTITATLL